LPSSQSAPPANLFMECGKSQQGLQSIAAGGLRTG